MQNYEITLETITQLSGHIARIVLIKRMAEWVNLAGFGIHHVQTGATRSAGTLDHNIMTGKISLAIRCIGDTRWNSD